MNGITSSSVAPSAYVCSVPFAGIQSQLSSSFASDGFISLNDSVQKCFFVDITSYKPLFDQETSTQALKISDMMSSQRRHLYDILKFSSFDDDNEALSFFERMREDYEDTQCFGQILKIFLGAYKKKDDSMIVKTLRFMQNFDYDEIGQVGVSATRMALLDSNSLDVQSAALSLVLCWKVDAFKSVVMDYKVPKDPFINLKMKKITSWYTSAKLKR